MAKIAFLGTGLIGTAFIELLLDHGDAVVVWNRTKSKAEALAGKGATVVDAPEEALNGAERVHTVFANDDVLDEIIERVAPALAPAVPVIDHSTVSPARVVARAMRLEARGVPFLHAPIFSPPPLVREKKATMLCAGREATYELHAGALREMAGDVWYLGERFDKAAAFKLFGNLFMAFVLSGLGDLFALARSLDISAPEAHELFKHFRPDATIDGRGARMAAGDFAPQFTMEMIRKDIGLMLETAQSGSVELAVLPRIAEVADGLIASGHGHDDAGAFAVPALGR